MPGDTIATTFGALLRRHREAAGFSQEELAERAELSIQAIGALEQGKRKRPYPATVRRLADALTLTADEHAALLASIPTRNSAGAGPPAPGGQEMGAAGDPVFPIPLTPLLGREDDLTRASELLQGGTRLLTLTGPGGVGKTRMALQIAHETRAWFPDGLAIVPLASLSDPGLVISTVAQALGVRESAGKPLGELLQRAIGERRVLLVLDNCEHVLTGLTEIVTLLEGCTHLAVLATTREPLRLRGEQEYPVPPLALPEFDHAATLAEAARFSAVRLFVERAQAARRDFVLTEDNASTVAAICGRLDGLPLALELAAPWLKVLSADALLGRLHHSLPILTGGWRDAPARQQTLRGAIGWSYELLEKGQRRLFRRLSVFAGGCTLEAAEALCFEPEEGGTEVLERLGSLVDKSLLQVQEIGSEPRFTMLETIREFATEKLVEQGEIAEMRERHAGYFVQLVEADYVPTHAVPARYYTLLETEQDNLRVAMDWATAERRTTLAHRLVYAHWLFWVVRGLGVEGQRRAQEVLSLEEDVDSLVRSRTLIVAGAMAKLGGDLERSVMLLDQALSAAREAKDSMGIATACQQLGLLLGLAGEPSRGRCLLEEGLVLLREANATRGMATTIFYLGALAELQERLDEACELWEESLTLYRALGERSRVAIALTNLAGGAVQQRDPQRAKRLTLECLPLAEQDGYTTVLWSLLGRIAEVAVGEGEAQQAARFLGAADVAREAAGEALEPMQRAIRHQTVETGRAQIGEARWDLAYQEGRGLALPKALALAKEYASS